MTSWGLNAEKGSITASYEVQEPNRISAKGKVEFDANVACTLLHSWRLRMLLM